MTSHRQASSNSYHTLQEKAISLAFIPDMVWNILAGRSVPGVEVVLSSSVLPTGGAEQEKEKALILCMCCSAITRTAVLPTLLQSHPKPGML